MGGRVGRIRLAVGERDGDGGIVVGSRVVQAGRAGVGGGVRGMAGRAPEGVDGGQRVGQRPETRRVGGAEHAVAGRGVWQGERVVRVGERQRGTEGLCGRVGRRRVQRGARRGRSDGGDGRPGRQRKGVEEGRGRERRVLGVVRVWAAREGVCEAGEVGGVGEVAAGAH